MRKAEQIPLLAMEEAKQVRPIWERLSPAGGPTCFSQYLHTPSGYHVAHCGHPTANFPYLIYTDKGKAITAPNGRGFMKLADAKSAVEEMTNATHS